MLVEKLDMLDYEINECLLSPTQFGIPNHRLRYYLTARRRDQPTIKEKSDYIESSVIHTTWPFNESHAEIMESPELSCFLESNANEDETFLVPAKYILKLHNFRLDIVRPSDKKTSCVTKAYGSHHIVTSGSVAQTQNFHASIISILIMLF
ncbi:tRNA (cytosine-5-)-methyltransferase [Apophysomyces sp. BC1034]|nr:tRNA (cytosine-5-)-methyltransferase [Apophysomyces sp. BC1034]